MQWRVKTRIWLSVAVMRDIGGCGCSNGQRPFAEDRIARVFCLTPRWRCACSLEPALMNGILGVLDVASAGRRHPATTQALSNADAFSFNSFLSGELANLDLQSFSSLPAVTSKMTYSHVTHKSGEFCHLCYVRIDSWGRASGKSNEHCP